MSDTSHLTIKDLMARLNVSKDVIRAAIRRGDLHALRFGSRLVIEPAEAEGFIRFVESQRAAAPDPDRPRGSYCASAPGGRCICRCHLISVGMQKLGPKAVRPDAWLPAHDTAIKRLIRKGRTPEQVATELTASFHIPRTAEAVKRRLCKLGISAREGWVSGEDLVRTLGVYRRRIQQWEANGILEGASWGSWRRYPLASVEALIRSQAGHTIDPRRIKNPQWKSLAEVSALVNARTA